MTAVTAAEPRPSEATPVLPGDAGYDAARTAWDLSSDQHPAAVCLPQTTEDVIAAVAYARTRGLRITTQGSGHNAHPLGDLSDTVLVKTTRMADVLVDPARRSARVGAGALWRQVEEAAAAHGLAALGGSSPDVSVGGYTLGGGLSFLGRRYGLAANRVHALEMVTADGRLVRVDAEHEPDLFWALRGGGGSFGIVTAMQFELLALTELYAGLLWYPIARAAEVLAAWRELTEADPTEDLTTVGRLLNFPDIPQLPEPVRGGSFVVVEVYHAGDPAEADRLLAPLRALAPINDTIAMVPPTAMFELHMDAPQPSPGTGDGMTLAELPAEALDAFLSLAGPGMRAPLLSAELRQLGGALGRAPVDGGAVASLPGRYLLFGAGMTPTLDSQRATRAQLEAMRATFAPWATPQTYINFAETSRAAAGLWAPKALSRLQQIKAMIDPDDVIRSNHPIHPEKRLVNPNDDVVAEFRANAGTVTHAMGGNLAGLDLLLLHHVGRRSGQAHIAPVSYMAYHDDYLLVGSFAGAPTEPQWVANVENANEVTVEIGARTRTMTATVLRDGPQRDSLYQAAREHWPFVLDYEEQTSRPFPVIQLAPTS
jgi:deazaflavin-dependent oxidoreductase (nitroreductase family)